MLGRIFIVAALIGAAGVAAIAGTAGPIQEGGPKIEVHSGRYDVDSVHSTAHFLIKHVGVSNFYGRFNKVSGKLVLDA